MRVEMNVLYRDTRRPETFFVFTSEIDLNQEPYADGWLYRLEGSRYSKPSPIRIPQDNSMALERLDDPKFDATKKAIQDCILNETAKRAHADYTEAMRPVQAFWDAGNLEAARKTDPLNTLLPTLIFTPPAL
jgi:hypothetical protein